MFSFREFLEGKADPRDAKLPKSQFPNFNKDRRTGPIAADQVEEEGNDPKEVIAYIYRVYLDLRKMFLKLTSEEIRVVSQAVDPHFHNYPDHDMFTKLAYSLLRNDFHFPIRSTGSFAYHKRDIMVANTQDDPWARESSYKYIVASMLRNHPFHKMIEGAFALISEACIYNTQVGHYTPAGVPGQGHLTRPWEFQWSAALHKAFYIIEEMLRYIKDVDFERVYNGALKHV